MSTEGQSPLLIGLTGSIGAGKSTVADIIRESHPVLDTDRIARELMERDEAVRAALLDRFGGRVYLDDNSLDRVFLATEVFGDERNLTDLNAIVHPPVIARVREEADALHANGNRVVYVESALIFEAGIEEEFDYTVAVVCNIERAIERVMHRDAVGREAAERRLRHQLSPEEKSGLSDFTIRNNGTLEELRRATSAIVLILSRLGKRSAS
ncbi:MAG: dephospho-CoA kinase [Bacteroidetes bacterium]|nr:dephospho-CoA kinase [Bacteroidota bacterium]